MPGPSGSDSGAHIPENLTAYSYLKTSCLTEDRQKNHRVFKPIIGHKLWKEHSKDKVDAGLDSVCLKTSITSFSFDYINGFDFPLNFWVPVFSYLPLLQEKGDNCRVPSNQQ